MDVKAASTRLLVSDITNCCKFYRDLLGLTVIVENPGYAEFEVAGQTISLFHQEEMASIIHTSDKPATADSQDKTVLIFTITDLDGTYSQLRQAGVQFDEPPTQNSDFNLKIAYCRDPEGNLIGLFENLM
ncbi:MAG: VOC family protein [Leptolyngbya sp. SIO3F4]|nr:VOC family protein [Leptolyngbya sp. SIO3F4]